MKLLNATVLFTKLTGSIIMFFIENIIAKELQITIPQVLSAIKLLEAGHTVPFIARYRKELTNGLDDIKLRLLEQKLEYLKDLESRKITIIESIEKQGKLTPELKQSIEQAETKIRLEDLYLPYKPKRRTKALIAIEAGLKPLAEKLLQDHSLNPDDLAKQFLNPEKNIIDIASALEGARYILIEKFAEDADLINKLREAFWDSAIITSKLKDGQEQAASNFKDYFDFAEKVNAIPSHRALAILRARQAGYLKVSLLSDYPFIIEIAEKFNIATDNDSWLFETVKWTWQVKLQPKLEIELISRMREIASDSAIKVFANNLRDLLMASPGGMKVTMGLDPGFKNGVKIAIIDKTGQLLAYDTIYPHPPQNAKDTALQTLALLCKQYLVELISIGNGTASRETDQLITELMKKNPDLKLTLTKVIISEAGASVYSASDLASEEFPNVDVTVRGAISIARRLQDPLAELVKIDPKSIGVGQYQHDVNQLDLSKELTRVVIDCVNAIGVDVNTASVPLLTYVAGLNKQIASNIVIFRNKNGKFQDREQLKQVAYLGTKAFEQSAGFLRINGGSNELDSSGVHPESYSIVEKILKYTDKNIKQILGSKTILSQLDPKKFIDEKFGIPTVIDILKELEKPGRDPRSEFKTAKFKSDINTISDLKIGMLLEGVVTNVANFGAFIDIGVHQDGLVHVSELANNYVKNPRDIVKTGDIVQVKILQIDVQRKRIYLTMRLDNNKNKDKNKNFSQLGLMLTEAFNRKTT